MSKKEFILRNISEQGGCWFWKLDFHKKFKKPLIPTPLRKKYGKWAHRAAFEAFQHKIPPNGKIWRVCRHKFICVNPDHMRCILDGETQPQQRSGKRRKKKPPKKLNAALGRTYAGELELERGFKNAMSKS